MCSTNAGCGLITGLHPAPTATATALPRARLEPPHNLSPRRWPPVAPGANCRAVAKLASRLGEVTASAKIDVQGGMQPPLHAFQLETACWSLSLVIHILGRRLVVLPESACMRALTATGGYRLGVRQFWVPLWWDAG